MFKFKPDKTSLLGLGVTILGIAGTILGAISHKNEQEKLKLDLKKEIMNDLSKKD